VGVGGSGTFANAVLDAAGMSHTCAAKSDDTIWCWGLNANGQLGDNTTTDRSWPVVVKGPRDTGTFLGVLALAAGESHTCAALVDGTVWCWGRNDKGQLGDGTTTDRATPVQVVGTGGTGTLTGVTGITAGQKHTCAVKGDGTVWCWGDNSKDELGDGTSTNRSSPVQVLGAGGTGTLTGVAGLAAGLQHVCAAKTDGTAWCWGLNDKGQLGDGTSTTRSSPVQVLGAGGTGTLTGVARLASGEGAKHTCAAKTDGTAWCWGLNDKGQLGDTTTTDRSAPVQVVGAGGTGTLAGVSRLTGGDNHTCAAKTDGTAWCWGLNDKGQLGDTTTTNRSWPVQVVGAGGTGTLAGVTRIAAGSKHVCAVKSDGTVWCWGLNDKGQLGDTTSTNRSWPVQVVGVGGSGTFANAVLDAAGMSHTCAPTTDQRAWCWGLNANGQLGDGTNGDAASPVRVR
jgi:alpha-tubulin suppressor-like RCC1 family protein